MKFDEFIDKYDGEGIDFDGQYGAQCVDLYRQYVKEVLEYPQSPPVEGAKDIWNTYLPDYYNRIENTPYGVPEKGDIVIFGTGLGKYGHVSIFIEGNASRFTSFDQNYPTGSLCHRQGHTYNAVIGWLRPLKKEDDMPKWLNDLLIENNQDPNNFEGWFRSILDKGKKYDEKVQELTKQVETLSETVTSLSMQIGNLTPKVTKLEEDNAGLKDDLAETGSKLAKANFRAEALEAQVQRLETENQRLKENNDVYAYTFWQRLISLFRKGR